MYVTQVSTGLFLAYIISSFSRTSSFLPLLSVVLMLSTHALLLEGGWRRLNELRKYQNSRIYHTV